MEDNKTYFGEIGHGLKTLAIGMKTTWKEYFKDFFTNKSTEQYPENRKTTLHVAKRHRGRLVFKRNEDGSYKCTACTLCEKACPNGTIKIVAHMAEDPETGKKKKVLDDYAYDLGDCNVAVAVPAGEVKIPYSLLLTRMNTMITLNLGDQKVDFHLWIEPSSADTFR